MLSIHWKIVFFFYFPLLPVRHFNEEHAHYVGLVVAYTWNREKQMFVALGKEFDMAFDCGRFRCIIKNEFTFKSDSAEVKKRPDCANNTI